MELDEFPPKTVLKKIIYISIKETNLMQSLNQDSYHNQNLIITTHPCTLGGA